MNHFKTQWVGALLCAWSTISVAMAAEVSLSLNLDFSTPGDSNSGGNWTVVAKGDERGLSAVNLLISDINFDPGSGYLAPRIDYSSGPPAGFSVEAQLDQVSRIELLQAEDILNPSLLFFDVGVIGGATQPGENGTPNVPAGVSSRQVPWGGYADNPSLVVFGSNADLGSFTGGVEIATGDFDPGVTPDWFDGGPTNRSDANLFTSVPFFAPGNIVGADNVFTTVRYIIPEPASFALLAIGLTSMIAVRRRG